MLSYKKTAYLPLIAIPIPNSNSARLQGVHQLLHLSALPFAFCIRPENALDACGMHVGYAAVARAGLGCCWLFLGGGRLLELIRGVGLGFVVGTEFVMERPC